MHVKRAVTGPLKEKDKTEITEDRPLVCSKGSEQEDSVAPNGGDYTENNVITLEASASKHPKIADGFVTEIQCGSTLL